VKKPPDKADLRRQLHRQMAAYLQKGGEIKHLEQGQSAFSPGERPPPTPLFNEPKADRTPVDDVVAALKARKEASRTRTASKRTRTQTRRRKQVIYDDFGEPMRVIWSDE
jgi:hypothetical protein